MTTELKREVGAWRRYLDGREVLCGDALELDVGSRWVPVRYEASNLGSRSRPKEWLYFAGTNSRIQLNDSDPAATYCFVTAIRWPRPPARRHAYRVDGGATYWVVATDPDEATKLVMALPDMEDETEELSAVELDFRACLKVRIKLDATEETISLASALDLMREVGSTVVSCSEWP